jgi:hypothetical protein
VGGGKGGNCGTHEKITDNRRGGVRPSDGRQAVWMDACESAPFRHDLKRAPNKCYCWHWFSRNLYEVQKFIMGVVVDTPIGHWDMRLTVEIFRSFLVRFYHIIFNSDTDKIMKK